MNKNHIERYIVIGAIVIILILVCFFGSKRRATPTHSDRTGGKEYYTLKDNIVSEGSGHGPAHYKPGLGLADGGHRH